jgi:hypothetical protein
MTITSDHDSLRSPICGRARVKKPGNVGVFRGFLDATKIVIYVNIEMILLRKLRKHQ